MTAGELLAASGLPGAEARALLAFASGATREALIAFPERVVAPEAAARFEALVERRRAGEPMAYLLGVQEFYRRPFCVTPAVLIPRPETELLVELALDALRSIESPRVLELGTGSGCIAISLALERPDARVVAADASVEALAIARANAQRLDARVDFVASDWYAAIAGEFDAIVANPPYVAASDPHLADLRFEPLYALTDHGDGLGCLRTIVAGAPAHLARDGWLLVEHGYDQAAAVRALFERAGFDEVRTVRDAAGIERACTGRFV
ncbi:MAG: peptide chain release factor N(5)-glutamine methyltransferase [Burkholderiaceae bacterium]|nr:peptide chain release factor N(5)-glutamine methyltransferase [Burkholderiaceae bacterium]GIL04141.1 MAG: release factor glutamine methyltransferase [Betaproteobacteria bacterium]